MTAKEILLRYRDARREASEIELKIAQLRLKYAAPSAIRYSDMPTAHDANHDLSDYAEKLEELEDLLISKYSRCIGVEIDVEKRLDRMENQTEREVLRHRYLDLTEKLQLQSWESVADSVHMSRRTVTRIHGTSLLNFPTD